MSYWGQLLRMTMRWAGPTVLAATLIAGTVLLTPAVQQARYVYVMY